MYLWPHHWGGRDRVYLRANLPESASSTFRETLKTQGEEHSGRHLMSTSSLCTHTHHTDTYFYTHIWTRECTHNEDKPLVQQIPALLCVSVALVKSLLFSCIPTTCVKGPQGMPGLQHLSSSAQVHMYLSQVKQLSQQHQHFQKKHRKKTPKKHLKKAEVLGKDDGTRVTRNHLLSSAYSSLKSEIRQRSVTSQALYEMLGFTNEICNGRILRRPKLGRRWRVLPVSKTWELTWPWEVGQARDWEKGGYFTLVK